MASKLDFVHFFGSSSERGFLQLNKFLERAKNAHLSKFITLEFASLWHLNKKNVHSRAKGLFYKLSLIFLCVIAASCQRTACEFEPEISYVPQRCQIESLPGNFPKLSVEERAQDWGKELYVGKAFAKEMDFYRAITCFKKALFLIPRNAFERRSEIEYDIFLSYYVAGKYQDAVEAFEGSSLMNASDSFPPIEDLRITLYDAYIRTDQNERANTILSAICEENPVTAEKLSSGTDILNADLCAIAQTEPTQNICQMLETYYVGEKSVAKAKALNAILPGAGYFYVGQKKSAITSFLINTLFIAASYQLVNKGYIAAGIITTSLEVGWYFGGINGAGIEASQYNRCLYERVGRETMVEERLFPILMIEHGF